MFNGLREGSLFYILRKGETPQLKIGQVVAKSNPKNKNGMPATPYGFPTETVVDITVKADDETYNFDSLDSNASFRIYPENNVFITDNREQMLSEVETMLRTSSQILESIPYHQNVVKACEDMQRALNPQLAKEKEHDEKIGALEEKISGMEDTLGNIQDMLAKALSGHGGSRKSNNQ